MRLAVFDDFLGGLIDQAIVEGLQTDTDFLVLTFFWLQRTMHEGNGAALSKRKLLDDLGDDAGADGTTTFTDGEAQTFFHGDRAISLTVIWTLSPGMTISVPSGSDDRAGHVGGAEVELRTVVVEERV